jgi:hypothetical protein
MRFTCMSVFPESGLMYVVSFLDKIQKIKLEEYGLRPTTRFMNTRPLPIHFFIVVETLCLGVVMFHRHNKCVEFYCH